MRMLKLSCLQRFSGTLKSTFTFFITSGWIWVLTSDSMAQVCLAVVAFLFFFMTRAKLYGYLGEVFKDYL